MCEASIIETRLYSLKIQMLRLAFWTHTFLNAGDTRGPEFPSQSLWPGIMDSYNEQGQGCQKVYHQGQGLIHYTHRASQP